MIKFTIATCFWKRDWLNEIFIKHFLYLKKKLKKTRSLKLNLVVALSKDINAELCENYKIPYIQVPNIPLGLKWNNALKLARVGEPDGVIRMGSDDFINEEILEEYVSVFLTHGKEVPLVGLKHFKYLSRRQKLVLNSWNGYVGPRKGEPIGSGRFFRKEILDRLNWTLFENNLNCNLDNSCNQKLMKFIGTNKSPFKLLQDLRKGNFELFCIKDDTQTITHSSCYNLTCEITDLNIEKYLSEFFPVVGGNYELIRQKLLGSIKK